MKARPECDACGERTKRLIGRDGKRACPDCRCLSKDKWAAALDELARIRSAS